MDYLQFGHIIFPLYPPGTTFLFLINAKLDQTNKIGKICGLKEKETRDSSTFINFAQTDQALYPLHMYLCYLKFGFGRALQDVGIEIRRGAMTRDQGKNLVKLYDGHYPDEFIEQYLDYYQMSLKEFNKVIDKWANKDLFKYEKGRWKPKFEII